MDKVSGAIRQQHHNQAVSSMPPPPLSLPLSSSLILSLSLSSLLFFFFLDKQRNRITIWTGPGAAKESGRPFRHILCLVKRSTEKKGGEKEEGKIKRGGSFSEVGAGGGWGG